MSKAWLDQLATEYRIVQDKIDKIAGFRFTIRGWSVTLLVAFAFGANTVKLPPVWLLSALVPVLAFITMEHSQERHKAILSARAIRIEKRIWRILRFLSSPKSEVSIGGMVPRLGHDLGEDSQNANALVRFFRRWGFLLFYMAQAVLVMAAAWWLPDHQKASTESNSSNPVVINHFTSEPQISRQSSSPEGANNVKTQGVRKGP